MRDWIHDHFGLFFSLLAVGLVCLVAACCSGCSITIPDWIDCNIIGSIPSGGSTTPNVPPSTTHAIVYPLDLGAWGGRPACAIDTNGTLHVVVDGTSSSLLLYKDMTAAGAISGGTIDGRAFNPRVKTLFNPSTVILHDWQLVTAWQFANGDPAGSVGRVYYRKLGTSVWRDLVVDPSPADWEPCKLCPAFGWGYWARYYGMYNDYRDLHINDAGALEIGGTPGNYNSGGGGGGEKEARWIHPSGDIIHVANAGCRRTTGAWYRNTSTCDNPVRWATYDAYPKMGSDDTGHAAVCGDLVQPGIGYMVASWDTGLVYNVWTGSRLLYPPDALHVLDRGGWSGLLKYPLSITSAPGGGAFIVWTNGGGLYLGRIRSDGSTASRLLWPGTIGAICTDYAGALHIVFNNAGHLWYRPLSTSEIGL